MSRSLCYRWRKWKQRRALVRLVRLTESMGLYELERGGGVGAPCPRYPDCDCEDCTFPEVER